MNTLFTRLLDDAAVFPPGSLSVDEAVGTHASYLASPYGDMVGPLVVADAHLDDVATTTTDMDPGSLDLAVTTPIGTLGDTLARTTAIPAVSLVGLEVSLDPSTDPVDVVRALGDVAVPRSVTVCVEVPRDKRRLAVIGALAGTRYLAKLRVGGMRADLYPEENELAEAIVVLVGVGLAFKATAGLHHAVRNTDPQTGFEQHGFLNLMLATATAMDEQPLDSVVRALAQRDSTQIARAIRGTDPCVREHLRSFGTCSVTDPVEELSALGLLR
jgi:hypothetical protein